MLWTVSSGLASFRITLIGVRQRLNAAVFPGGVYFEWIVVTFLPPSDLPF